MRHWLATIIACLVFAIPSIAAVVSSATVPATRADGYKVTASDWNDTVIGVYSYINNNIVRTLNTLTTKGDMYVHDGGGVERLAIGNDNAVLTCDSTTGSGLAWKMFAAASTVTTKGDLQVYNGSAVVRLPVGTNDQVLIADSAQSAGIKWGTVPAGIPQGSICAWSPAAAGTSTIPTGWLLADGTSGTPNLIGMFVIGTRPSGSTSTANASGYGVYSADGLGGGATTHSHTATLSGTTSSGGTSGGLGTAGGYSLAAPSHTHTVSAGGTTSSASTEPSDWALVYIVKQ